MDRTKMPTWPLICEWMPNATHEERLEAHERLDDYLMLLMKMAEREERERMAQSKEKFGSY
jgi:hypothetical protein